MINFIFPWVQYQSLQWIIQHTWSFGERSFEDEWLLIMVFVVPNSSYLYSSFIAELYFGWIMWWNKSGFYFSIQEKVRRKNEFVFVALRFLRTSQLERHSWTSHLTVSSTGDLTRPQEFLSLQVEINCPSLQVLFWLPGQRLYWEIVLKQLLASVLVLHLCMLFLSVSPPWLWPV